MKEEDVRGYASRKGRHGYSALAAAIIASGIKANDQRFLESDWCSTLRDIVDISTKSDSNINQCLSDRIRGSSRYENKY